MNFSERMGFTPLREQLQVNSVDNRLKNMLWNSFKLYGIIEIDTIDDKQNYLKFGYNLWIHFWGNRIDQVPMSHSELDIVELNRKIESWYFDVNRKWYEYYNFIEYTLKYYSNDDYIKGLNMFLSKEGAAYRVVENKFVRITSDDEIQSIEESLNTTSDKYKPVNTHIKSALSLLSNREKPDYRNSVKESISAVESLCKTLVSNDKARLSQAIKLLKEKHNSHPALLESFEKLYGYTSDGDGIRHSLTDDGKEVDFHDAKFMLVTCSAFINYMIGKLG